jgi:hypothetical protein
LRTIRLVILAITTVLGWSAAVFLLRTDVHWWDEAVSTAFGVILAYPLIADLGVDGRRYLKFGIVGTVGVPILTVLFDRTIPQDKGHWITLPVLAFAFGGWFIQTIRRRHA